MPRLIKISSAAVWLQQTAVDNLSPATELIAKSMAGRIRYLYELATGTAAHTDGPGTPINPQGRLGIDHSGPPWGTAFPHPLWTAESTPPSGDIYGESPVVTVANGAIRTIRARFIVRPFQPGDRVPYSRAYLAAAGRPTSGAGTSTVTFRLYDGPGIDGTTSKTATLTSTGATSLTLSTALYTSIEPPERRRRPSPTEARWPTIERRIEISNTSGVSMDIVALSLNQIVRRSH